MKDAGTTIEVRTIIPGCGYKCCDFEIEKTAWFGNDITVWNEYRCANMRRCEHIVDMLNKAEKEETENGKRE